MPELDLVMLLVWLVFIIFGGLTGTVRQVLLFVSLYAAAILAGTTYSYAAAALKLAIDDAVSTPTLNGYMLCLLFPVLALLFYLGLASVWRETQPAGSAARRVDTVVGGLIGLFNGLLFTVAVYAALAFAAQSRWPTADNARLALLDQVHRSALQPALLEKLPVAYIALRPWFPRGLPGFPAA